MSISHPPYRDRKLPDRFQIWLEQFRSRVITDSNEIRNGTFTPFFYGTGGGPPTYSTQQGSYLRIGTKVWADIDLVVQNKAGITGALSIGGLPFNNKFGERPSYLAISMQGIFRLNEWTMAYYSLPSTFMAIKGIVDGIQTTNINSATELFAGGLNSLSIVYNTRDA